MTDRPLPIWIFAAATLTPAALITIACLWGGWWSGLALLYLVGLTTTLDLLVRRTIPATQGEEFPVARMLTAGLGIVHFGLLGLVVWSLSWTSFTLPVKTATFLAAALFFGQVSNANAHELIHRPQRALHKLGMWVYVTLMFGHHTSAHPLVHHVHVGTRADPSTARLGESYYRFALRAWRGSFLRGWREESLRSARINRPLSGHPYVIYGCGALLSVGLALTLGGWVGLGVYLGLAILAQSQLLMSDYVQHYGLMRHVVDGKPEPVNARHSWNSGHVLSSAMTMNAPRHSDHHIRPNRPYAALTLPEDVPLLPRSLPIMAFVALYPPRFRQLMDPLARRWQQDAEAGKFTVS